MFGLWSFPGDSVGAVGKGPPLARSVGSSVAIRTVESDPSVAGVSVDVESSLVDHYLMVEPAKSDQIVRVGGPALRPGGDVVDFESVSAVTSVCGASVAVTVDDRST